VTPPRRARALLLLACALACACTKDADRDKPVKVIELGPRYAHEATPIPPPSATASSAPLDPPAPWTREGTASPSMGANPTPTARPSVTGSADAAPAKAVDPDEAIREALRVSAGGCFASLPAGGANPKERSAHITVMVIPTGTVSRAEVSSGDTTAPGVLACLRERAQSTVFSDNHGGPLRTYEIEVRVVAADRGQVH
jgi:hypothetical protein